MISPYNLAKTLFPINRSLTGTGNLKTLNILKKNIKNLEIKFYKSGLKAYDWIVPKEWNVNEAWIKDQLGNKILDFKNNNLHVISYSDPINLKMNYKDLTKNIYFLKSKPDALPYITTYYKSNWGFSMTYNQFKSLNKNSNYEVFIDSNKKNGKMYYAEYIKKGLSKKEIIFTTYICHPSMANNELSGPCVLTSLANWLQNKKTKYSYRFLFIPETIGSIAYISQNYSKLKKNILAGYVVTCVGDERSYSYIPGPSENNISSEMLSTIYKKMKIKAQKFSWYKYRGSDERQFCSPNVNLPFSTIMRTKFGNYYEYHTSLDKLDSVVTKKGLNQSLKLLRNLVIDFENSIFPKSKINCEPFLERYDLYSRNQLNINAKDLYLFDGRKILNVLSCCNGKNNVTMISKKIGLNTKEILKIIKLLKKKSILSIL